MLATSVTIAIPRKLLASVGVIFTILILLVSGCPNEIVLDNIQGPTVQTNEREKAMIDVIPDSPSAILRATHILLIRIVDAQIGEWGPHPNSGQQRRSELALEIEDLLKGKFSTDTGETVRVSIDQFKSDSLFILPPRGVWSDKSLDEGTRLLTFSINSGEMVEEILQEPSCFQLVPAEGSEASVRLAIQAETEDWTFEQLVIQANEVANSLDYIFAEYLNRKVSEEAIQRRETFERLMQFLENPDMVISVLMPLLDETEAIVGDDEADVPEWQVNRFAVGLFRLLAISSAEPIHDEIIESFLPEFLNLVGEGRPRRADDIFREYPGEREKAINTLRNYEGEASTDELLGWLR
jgi:hypothetical protein